MEITVVTSLATVGNMEINTCQLVKNGIVKLATNTASVILLFFLIWSSSKGICQTRSAVQIVTNDGKILRQKKIASDSSFRDGLNEIIENLRADGYLLAEIKQDYEGDSIKFRIEVGRQYEFAFIDWNKFPKNYLNLAGVRTRKDRYSARAMSREISKMLVYSQETGFPFARVNVDSAGYKNGLLSIQLGIDSGPKVNFDSLMAQGINKTKGSYLQNYLGVVPGRPYRQSIIKELENKIEQLNFLTLNNTPTVDFVNNMAKVKMELSENKVNTFDGVVGLLQNEGDNRVTITGIVDLELYNLFGTGKSLELHWQQQRELSQSLDLTYEQPQLFKSSLGLNFNYNQLKEDTTFINRNIGLGLTIPWKNVRMSLSYLRTTGRILSGNIENPEDPDIADFNIDNYQLIGTIGQFTQGVFRKQWEFNLGIKVGDKRILRNPLIADSYYQLTDLKSTQYSFLGQLTWKLPIGESLLIYQNIEVEKLFNEELFLNDLFRLGGLNSLRGFNELEFFVNQYALSNLELRWLWNSKSYLFGFYDQAFFELEIADNSQSDNPLGVGAGVSLTTDTGVFRLVYALGSSDEQVISFNQAKIHFGFTSRF
ncbi:MAG: BamA/TamA family outer membrane protein [Bacteroidota bacterium]